MIGGVFYESILSGIRSVFDSVFCDMLSDSSYRVKLLSDILSSNEEDVSDA